MNQKQSIAVESSDQNETQHKRWSHWFLLSVTVSLIATSLLTMAIITNYDASSAYNKRQLRVFDPDHRNCGDNEVQHWYAVHCVYGATFTVFPKYYIEQKTVTTDVDLSADDRLEIELVIRVLSSVARKTNRAVRVRIPLQLTYWGEYYVDDIMEAKQPWTIVSAIELDNVGVKAVEPGYWIKADGWRSVNKRALHSERKIKLMDEGNTTTADSALNNLEKLLQFNRTEITDEWIFSLDELKLLDTSAVGQRLAGKAGGFENGNWLRNFVCPKYPDVIGDASHTLDKKVQFSTQ